MSLKETLLEMKKKNLFEILEIEDYKNVRNLDIRKAKRTIGAKYHPDKYSTQEEKELASEIITLVYEASDLLADSDFREKYIESGFKDKQDQSNTIRVVKEIKKNNSVRDRGLSLTALAEVSSEDLIKGKELKVTPTVVEGLDVDSSERTIEIPKGTRNGSFIVYSELGEQVGEGLNGDLIVSVSTNDTLTEPTKSLLTVGTKIPLIDLANQKEINIGLELKRTDKPKLTILKNHMSFEKILINH